MILSFSVLILGIYGPHMLKERCVEEVYSEGSTIGTTDVADYFKQQGYNAWNISPSKYTSNWTAFTIRNGELQVVTVYTDGRTISGHEYALA